MTLYITNSQLYTVCLYANCDEASRANFQRSQAKNSRLKLNSFLVWRKKAGVLLSLCLINKQEIPVCCYLQSLCSCIGLQCINRCCASIHVYFQGAYLSHLQWFFIQGIESRFPFLCASVILCCLILRFTFSDNDRILY